MKTTACHLPLTLRAKSIATAHTILPPCIAGLLVALLVHQLTLHGLFGFAGDRYPVALAGAAAWLFVGVGLNSGSMPRAIAHLVFATAVFTGAVAGATGPASAMSPWFAAQAIWILVHRNDIESTGLVAGWVSFNAALASALLMP